MSERSTVVHCCSAMYSTFAVWCWEHARAQRVWYTTDYLVQSQGRAVWLRWVQFSYELPDDAETLVTIETPTGLKPYRGTAARLRSITQRAKRVRAQVVKGETFDVEIHTGSARS